jgi:hypothetical protein
VLDSSRSSFVARMQANIYCLLNEEHLIIFVICFHHFVSRSPNNERRATSDELTP